MFQHIIAYYDQLSLNHECAKRWKRADQMQRRSNAYFHAQAGYIPEKDFAEIDISTCDK